MIYLDNAATSFPKPASVCREVYRCMTKYCGNPGRSGHSLSLEAAKKIFECRCSVADLLGVGDPARVIFTLNTTHALNLVIKGLLKRGDHIIISDLEHNSVLRPVHKLSELGTVEYSVFHSAAAIGPIDPQRIRAEIARLIRPNTRLVVCTHSSNICSANLPIDVIAALCKEHGLLFVVDAAQSAGHLDINVDKMKIDALCAPAHKGLYGPQGCGIAVLGEGITLDTLTEGGNGVNSLEPFMPDFSPERYEAGTCATPAIAGLCEGIKHIKSIGIKEIHRRECELYEYALQALGNMRELALYGEAHVGSTLLFNVRGILSEECAYHLNKNGICVRAGYHCSPLGHSALFTPEGGAVRVSFGIHNKKSDVDALTKAVSELTK